MQRASCKFVIIHEDYLLASDGDVGCAAILKILESLSETKDEDRDSWIGLTAKAIEAMTLGIVPRKNVWKKMKILKEKGFIEICLKENNWPLYKLNVQAFSSTLTSKRGDPSPQNAVTLTSKRGDIYSIKNSIKEKHNLTTEESSIRETVSSLIDNSFSIRKEEFMETENLKTDENAYRTEKEQNNNEGDADMNPDVRAVLKSYDRIPKGKRSKADNASIATLYKNHGEKLEQMVERYGLDDCLSALEVFKEDAYWNERNLPIRGFISQIERFLKNASDTPGGDQGIAKHGKIAPRPVSAQIPATPGSRLDPVFETKEREVRFRKNRRVDDILFMLKGSMSEELDRFTEEARDIDIMEPASIERWFQVARDRWKETHGGFEPSCVSRPVC